MQECIFCFYPIIMTRTKNNILNVYFLFFLSILLIKFFSFIYNGYAKESWPITEFLINYEGGFVRRGLLGQVILYIYQLTGINPYTTILFLCISAYVILIGFFVKSFIHKGYTLFFLPFVFFLGNPIIHDFWVRKDIIIVLFFIVSVHFAVKDGLLNVIYLNLLLSTSLLIHESSGFLVFPILFLILQAKYFSSYNNSKILGFLVSILRMLPAILVFFCVLYFKGSPEIANKIWASWKAIDFPIQTDNYEPAPAAIDAISWSLSNGLSSVTNTLKNFNDGIYAPIAWILIIAIIYFILTNTSELKFSILNYKPTINFNRIHISAILILQLACVLPLFILGWDYGRWIFYWTATSFAIIILIPEKLLNTLFPKFILVISTTINNILDRLLNKSTVLMFCLLIGFSGYSWYLISAVNSSALYITIRFISEILKQIMFFIKDLI
jgi:hypothetical protein